MVVRWRVVDGRAVADSGVIIEFPRDIRTAIVRFEESETEWERTYEMDPVSRNRVDHWRIERLRSRVATWEAGIVAGLSFPWPRPLPLPVRTRPHARKMPPGVLRLADGRTFDTDSASGFFRIPGTLSAHIDYRGDWFTVEGDAEALEDPILVSLPVLLFSHLPK